MIYKFTLESYLVGKITCFNGYIIYEQLLGDNAVHLRQTSQKWMWNTIAKQCLDNGEKNMKAGKILVTFWTSWWITWWC